VKLKILAEAASLSFLPLQSKKLFYQKKKTALALLVKLLYGTEAEIKTISLVKLCKALPNKP